MSVHGAINKLRSKADLRPGRSQGMPTYAFKKKALEKGIKVEYEHTRHRAVSQEIAKDHLAERPDYYEKLEKMEKTPVEKTAVINAFFDEMEKIAKAKSTKEKPDASGKDLTVGAAGVGAAGLAIKPTKELITGRTRLYHGTAPSNVPSIMEKGVLPTTVTGQRGVTDLLEESAAAPTRRMAMLTKKKSLARDFASKGEQLKSFFKRTPGATQADVAAEHIRIAQSPEYVAKVTNPFNNQGMVAADVPMWRSDVAKTVRANPEARGGFSNYMKGTGDLVAKSVRDRGIPMDPEMAKMVSAPSRAMTYPALASAKGFEGGLSPEFIRGSRHFKGLTMREVGQYARAKPGRFAGGLALGAAGIGAAAYGAKRVARSFKNRDMNVEKTSEAAPVELAKKQHAMKNEEQLLKTLKPGDMLFSAPHRKYGRGFMGRVFKPISRMIQGTDFGHTAMYVGDGKIVDTRIEREARTEPLKKLITHNNIVAVRPRGSTIHERDKAVEYAKSRVGTPYSKRALLRAATPFQGKFKGKGPEEDKALMCSGLVANAYSGRKFAPVSRRFIRPSQILTSKQVQPVAYLETAPQPM